jgi:hypothetical protein
MIAKAYGETGTRIEQDSIFEYGSVAEAPRDGISDTPRVGLYDSPSPAAQPFGPEVQEGLKSALEVSTLDQYDTSSLLGHTILRNFIENKRPVLWLDHGGWPANQSGELPPPSARQYMGHANPDFSTRHDGGKNQWLRDTPMP